MQKEPEQREGKRERISSLSGGNAQKDDHPLQDVLDKVEKDEVISVSCDWHRKTEKSSLIKLLE